MLMTGVILMQPLLTLDLPSHKSQTEFNLKRWSELRKDRNLAKSRVELKPIALVE